MASNYEIARDRTRSEFKKYDTGKMVAKFGLQRDEEYVYIPFMGRDYRIHRESGVVESTADGFKTVEEAGFEESLTLYDVLCYSADDCSLSGEYVPLDGLLGAVHTVGPGGELFQRTANEFSGHLPELERACCAYGEKLSISGDLAVRLQPFAFLPMTLQYWEADEEFPPVLKFMFDKNIFQYMHYETIFYMLGHVLSCLREKMDLAPRARW